VNRGDINLSAEKNLKLLAVDTSGYMIQSVIVLNNPNLLSATVKTIRERFSIDNVLVGVIDNELNQGIPGRKESEFPVNIRFPKNILEAVADTHTTVKIKSSVTVKVK
jgi:LEA14-like dessication related protein